MYDTLGMSGEEWERVACRMALGSVREIRREWKYVLSSRHSLSSMVMTFVRLFCRTDYSK